MKKYLLIFIVIFTSTIAFTQEGNHQLVSSKQNDMEQSQEKVKMRIDIMSDIVCPWCYIGYYRLKKALSLVSNEIEADIHWHPYILNGHYNEGGVNYKQHLIKKYGRTAEEVDEIRAHHTAIGEELGFQFSYFEDMHTYNSIKAHQLVRLAREYGKEAAMKVRLMTAFFGEQKNIADIPTLLKEAETIGLDLERCKKVLENDEYAEGVYNEISEWESTGINSVPTYLINRKYVISGAQDPNQFAKMLQRIAKEK